MLDGPMVSVPSKLCQMVPLADQCWPILVTIRFQTYICSDSIQCVVEVYHADDKNVQEYPKSLRLISSRFYEKMPVNEYGSAVLSILLECHRLKVK